MKIYTVQSGDEVYTECTNNIKGILSIISKYGDEPNRIKYTDNRGNRICSIAYTYDNLLRAIKGSSVNDKLSNTITCVNKGTGVSLQIIEMELI